MRYRLIALDLDGTLLPDGKTIPEENIKAVRYAAEKGVHVVIATGRVTPSGRAFARALGLESFIISSNGARIYDMKNRKVVFDDGLDIEEAKAAAKYFERLGVYYHAYVDDIMYARYMRPQLRFYMDQNEGLEPELRMDIRICEDFDDVFESNRARISKVMTIEDDLSLIAEMKRCLSVNGRIVIMSSHENNIEIMNHTVSKGNAVRYLAGMLGIRREEVIAIGDNDNDISMIRWAGMGIAMGNAIDGLKAVADDTTGECAEAGVAKAIYRYI